MFLASNAGKRSLAVELGDERGREIVLRLADRADVFVQSLRPGAAERHGLGAAGLRARNPRLVYCSIGAFGARGPLSDQPGYDPLLQAASGIMSVTGEAGRPPARVGVSLIDLGTGVWAALGVLAALYERERTGAGRTLEVSLYETALSLLAYAARRLPRRRRRAGPRGQRLPADRAVPGLSDPRRRAHDRRRERQALRGALRRPRRAGAGRGPALPHESRPRRQPGGAGRAARGAHSGTRVGGAPRGARRRGRPRVAGARRRRGGAAPPDGGARDPAVARRLRHGRRAALGRRRARAPPRRAAGARRAHRGDPPRARLRGGRDRGLASAGVVRSAERAASGAGSGLSGRPVPAR